MKKVLLLICSIGFLLSGVAFAGGRVVGGTVVRPAIPQEHYVNTGFYIGLHGGITAFNGAGARAGLILGAQAGYGFTRHIRGEVSFSYLRNKFFLPLIPNLLPAISGNTQAYLIMMNAYYDFHATPIVDPFVGAGVGFDRMTRRNLSPKAFVNKITATHFAYQLIAGLGLHITQNFLLIFRYRFIGSDGAYYNVAGSALDYYFG